MIQNQLPLSLTELSSRPEDFLIASPNHGAGHTNRVIFLTQLLARLYRRNDALAILWAAAYLHDRARINDYPCDQHGCWAVEKYLVALSPKFRRAGVDDAGITTVANLVINHCQPTPIPKGHPDHDLSLIFRDADTLDRTRFNGLDPSYLHLNRSAMLARFAHGFALLTGPNDDLPRVWHTGVTLMAPKVSLADHPYKWDPSETAVARRNRRLAQAQRNLHEHATAISRTFWAPQFSAMLMVAQAAQQLTAQSPGSCAEIRALMATLEPMCLHLRASAHRLVMLTFGQDFESFKAHGIYKGFWEVGPTWHSAILDEPHLPRLAKALALYGEREAYTTHGVLLDPSDKHFEHTVDRLRMMYGDHCIRWKPGALEACSFSVNDSQESGAVLPFSIENYVKAMILSFSAEHLGLRWPRDIATWNAGPLHFVEFQHHGQLTTQDVDRFDPYPIPSVRASFALV